MTSRAVRRLRRPSRLRPTSASASDRLKATYRAWTLLMNIYREWATKQQDPGDPAGIAPVSLRWVTSFDDFVDDMGLRPDDMVLVAPDRKRPIGPGNCRWGKGDTPGHRGRRSTLWLTRGDQTHTVREWSALLGISYKTIYSRLSRGATPDEALATAQESR